MRKELKILISAFVLISILILIPARVSSSEICQYASSASATSENSNGSLAIYAIGSPNAPSVGECGNWSGYGYTWSPANWDVKANLTLGYNLPVSASNFTIFGDYDMCWSSIWIKNNATGKEKLVFSGPNNNCTLTIKLDGNFLADTIILETCGWSWSSTDAVQLCGNDTTIKNYYYDTFDNENGIAAKNNVNVSGGDVKILQVVATAELLKGYSQSTWGTGSSNTDDPYNTFYHDSRAQAIYLASDLTTAGVTAGNITAIQLYSYQVHGRSNLKNFRIRMKQTSATTTTSWEGNWITVYGPVDVTTTAGQWKTYNFSVPFYWDGKSNLMIDISRDDTAYTSGGGMYRRINVGSNRMFSGYCDSCTLYNYASGTTSGTAKNYLPSIKINYGYNNPTADLTSIAITPSNLGIWNNFCADDNLAQGTKITYALLNISNNQTIPGYGNLLSGCTNISSLSTDYSSIRLFANLSTTNISNIPILHSWNVSWTVINPPTITINQPLNQTYYSNSTIMMLNFSVSDDTNNATSCWKDVGSGWISVGQIMSGSSYQSIETAKEGFNSWKVRCFDGVKYGIADINFNVQTTPAEICQYAEYAEATGEVPGYEAVYATGKPNSDGNCSTQPSLYTSWVKPNFNVTANLTLTFSNPIYPSNLTIFGDWELCLTRVWLWRDNTWYLAWEGA